jgi:OmpA-OmpF porin, OOP family
MRFKISGAAAALLLASMAPALAQMTPGGAVAWNGFYLGLNFGGSTGSSTLSTPALTGNQLNPRGPLGGGTVGYNWAFNPTWVLGFEGDIDATGIGGSKGCPVTSPSTANCFVGNSWLGSARMRLGVTPNGGPMLLYVTGGGEFGDVNKRVVGTSVSGRVAADATNSGWTVGAGGEYMISPQWSMKLEYRYSDLGSSNAVCTNATLCGAGGTAVKASFTQNTVLAGLNFHFNAPPPPPPAPMAAPAPPPPAPKVFIVFFDWDKDTITPEGQQIIGQAADAYKAGAPVQIQVTGYTDRSGSPGYNQRLSERRANNVAKAMAALGVPKNEMIVAGRGENDNRVPTAPGVREPQNRRVEIVEP